MNDYRYVKDITRHYRTERHSPAFYFARDFAVLAFVAIVVLGGILAAAEVFGG